MHAESIDGKLFRSATGEEFGVIRKLDSVVPSEIAEQSFEAFAEDESGNFFVQKNGVIAFWDHETNEFLSLASSEKEFLSCLVLPEAVPAQSSKIVSAWIDPEFLKEQNNQ
ncbi:MAG: hypothetical protein QM803_03275 [Rhodocyclaceae bacterium]